MILLESGGRSRPADASFLETPAFLLYSKAFGDRRFFTYWIHMLVNDIVANGKPGESFRTPAIYNKSIGSFKQRSECDRFCGGASVTRTLFYQVTWAYFFYHSQTWRASELSQAWNKLELNFEFSPEDRSLWPIPCVPRELRPHARVHVDIEIGGNRLTLDSVIDHVDYNTRDVYVPIELEGRDGVFPVPFGYVQPY